MAGHRRPRAAVGPGTVRCCHTPVDPACGRVRGLACGPSPVNRYGGPVAADNDHLRWTDRPDTNRPVLVVAFEGWNDAGSAATTAVSHVEGCGDRSRFATSTPRNS